MVKRLETWKSKHHRLYLIIITYRVKNSIQMEQLLNVLGKMIDVMD